MTEGVQGYAKGQALNWLIQQRGKDEMKFFQAILKNRLRAGDYPDLYPNEKHPDRLIPMNSDTLIQQVWFGRPNGQPEMHACLMKDVALAFLIIQSGGKIQDYGFETQPGVVINQNQLGFGQYAFPSEEKRTAAFVKWGWKQLKDSLGGPVLKESPKVKTNEAPRNGPKSLPPRRQPVPLPVAPPPPVPPPLPKK